MIRACDLALIAHHLAEALRYAKAQNLDVHFISELDHLNNQAKELAEEDN